MTIWNKTFEVANKYFYWMYVRSSSLLVNNSVVKYVWDAPPYHSCTFFLNFSKGWEDVGYSNQWYIKNWRSYKGRLYWKQKFWIKIQIWDSFWILTDVPFGPPWTWAPRNLVHLVTCATCFSGDPNYNVVFFVGLKKSSLCVGVLTKLVSSNCW